MVIGDSPSYQYCVPSLNDNSAWSSFLGGQNEIMKSSELVFSCCCTDLLSVVALHVGLSLTWCMFYIGQLFVSDIAVFVLKRDVKPQLTNYRPAALSVGEPKSVEAVKRTQSTEANQGKQPMANGHPFLIHLLTPQERDIAAAFTVVHK